MAELRFTADHEWLRTEDDGTVTIGITGYAQDQLGDVVFVELPENGRQFTADDELVVVESVKAAGEIKAPVAGEVLETNGLLADKPELVNSDPEGEGWMVRIRPADAGELEGLMDRTAYDELVKGL